MDTLAEALPLARLAALSSLAAAFSAVRRACKGQEEPADDALPAVLALQVEAAVIRCLRRLNPSLAGAPRWSPSCVHQQTRLMLPNEIACRCIRQAALRLSVNKYTTSSLVGLVPAPAQLILSHSFQMTMLSVFG